jgi:IS30 family transposase
MARHFNGEDRKLIYRLLKAKTPKAQIARLLDRSPSTIYREVNRNSGKRGYRPKQAQRKAEERRRRCHRRCKMDEPRVFAYVTEKLKQCWSPDQIAGRMRRDFPRQPELRLSRQTIYNWLQPRKDEWRHCLRHGRRRFYREKRGQLTDCVRIEGRPKIIDRRRRFGDWEGDTVVGKRRRSAVLTMVERKSGYLQIGKLSSLRSASAIRSAAWQLGWLPEDLQRSLTLDNGKEFAHHKRLTARTGVEVYFAKPYAAWQRGTNENTNGLLRQFFPKGTDFTRISRYVVARVEKLLNERPRFRLNYRTPSEILAPKLRCI